MAPQTVERMADSVRHRGPDDAGYHFEPGLGLGHRRLSIIDLHSGHQPLSNEDGTIWIIFNGEIYNFLELRALLVAKGHVFRTHSDTEAIVHLYEEYGEECFSKLRGMFAIALWDGPRRKLVLARDRVGKKPLFYAYNGQRLIFGSELKAVLASGQVREEVDSTALADYFALRYVPAPKTIYKEVRKLRPAHYLVVSAHGLREQSYWDLSFAGLEDRTEQQWCEQIREGLLEATRVRLISDVPLGSFLSGGVDSSAVVACMARLLHHPVTTCSVGFDEESYSEVGFAREVAEHIGADHHEDTVRPTAAEIVDRLAWHYDEPFADSSAIPTYYVSRAARQHVTVALSGDGGDETFAGYRRYAETLQEDHWRSLFPSAFRRHLLGPLASWYPTLEGAPRVFRAKSLMQRMVGDSLETYLQRIMLPGFARESLFTSGFLGELGNYDPLEQVREHYRRSDALDLLSRLQYVDIKTYLPDDICAKVDRASMAVSLEVRAPLLDHRLMELAARIPPQLKLREGSGKFVFKKAIQEMVPRSVVTRRKQGFGVPVAEWFRGELRERAREILFQQDDILQRRTLQRIWNQHQQGIRDHSALLWAVFMFRQWQGRFGRGQYAPAMAHAAAQPSAVGEGV